MILLDLCAAFVADVGVTLAAVAMARVRAVTVVVTDDADAAERAAREDA